MRWRIPNTKLKHPKIMLIGNILDKEVESTDVLESIDFSLDQSSMNMLFKGFSDSLYSNKIGSVVREITSNCFDSHVEAGVTKDVEIEFVTGTNSQRSIIFRDFGVGLSPERVKNIYSKYFSSTKRDTNNQIGGFGLGSKTPLSYSEMFTARTRVDGTEYVYLIHRGTGAPVIKLIDSAPTPYGNGTEIIIPIKDFTDECRFIAEIKSQLVYFDSVKVLGCSQIDNNYSIYRGKHFLYRTNCSESYVHIALGKVSYPIDYFQLGMDINQYKMPVALRFEVGDLSVTMNREALEYTDSVKDKIRTKMQECFAELTHMARIQSGVYDSLEEALKATISKGIKLDEGVFIPTGSCIDIQPPVYSKFAAFRRNPLVHAQVLNSVVLLDTCLDYSGTVVKAGRRRRWSGAVMSYNDWSEAILYGTNPVYRMTGSLATRKSRYIAHAESISPSKMILIIKPQDDEFIRSCYKSNYSDAEIEIIKKELLKMIIKKTKSYDRTEIDPIWLQEYLQKLRDQNPGVVKNAIKRDTTQVHTREMKIYGDTPPEVHFSIVERRVNELAAMKKIIVYARYSEIDKLERLAKILISGYDASLQEKVLLIKVSEESVKKIKDFAVHVDEFYIRHSSLISRIAVAWKASKLLNDLGIIQANNMLHLLPFEDLAKRLLLFVYGTFTYRAQHYKKLLDQIAGLYPDGEYRIFPSSNKKAMQCQRGLNAPIDVLRESLRINKILQRAPLLHHLGANKPERGEAYENQIIKYLEDSQVIFKSKKPCQELMPLEVEML